MMERPSLIPRLINKIYPTRCELTWEKLDVAYGIYEDKARCAPCEMSPECPIMIGKSYNVDNPL